MRGCVTSHIGEKDTTFFFYSSPLFTADFYYSLSTTISINFNDHRLFTSPVMARSTVTTALLTATKPHMRASLLIYQTSINKLSPIFLYSDGAQTLSMAGF